MNKRKLSFIYLVLGTLAMIGFISFFFNEPQILQVLFIVAIPFYLATLTLTIFIHPVLCLVRLIKKHQRKESIKVVLYHLIWSVIIAGVFTSMILNGYTITA